MVGTARVDGGTLHVRSLEGNGEIGTCARQGLSWEFVATNAERESGIERIGCFSFIERIC